MHLTAFIINPVCFENDCELFENCETAWHISLRNKKAGRQCDNTLPAGDCFEKETAFFSVDLFLGKEGDGLEHGLRFQG